MSKLFAFLLMMLALTAVFSYAITSSTAEYRKSPCEFQPYKPPPPNLKNHKDLNLKNRSGHVA